MDPDPDTDDIARLLNRTRRCNGRVRLRERGHELVAPAIDLHAPRCGECVSNRAPMPLERLRIGVAELLHEPRRALDVGQQEGDAHPGESTPSDYAYTGSRAAVSRPREAA